MEKDNFRALKADGTLDRLSADVQRLCKPVWCWRETGGPPEIINGGTVSFVDTGSARLAVTCFHVIDGILRRWSEKPDITCQVGNHPLFPERVQFRFNESAHLATFGLDGMPVEYFPAPRWPPAALVLGDWLFLAGFPNIRREVLGVETMTSDFVSFHGRISGASTNHATLTVDSTNWFFSGEDSVLPYSDYGGMSGGGPAFRGNLALLNGAEIPRSSTTVMWPQNSSSCGNYFTSRSTVTSCRAKFERKALPRGTSLWCYGEAGLRPHPLPEVDLRGEHLIPDHTV